MHPITAADELDARHKMQWPNVGMMPLGDDQIIAIQRISRIGLAANVAIAQMHARALFDTVRIDEPFAVSQLEGVPKLIAPAWIKRHRELELFKPSSLAHGVGRLLQELHPSWPLTVWHGLDVHHPSDGFIVRRHNVPVDLLRPARSKNATIGHRGDVGIDQGPATHGRTLGDGHRAEYAQIKPAVPLLGRVLIPPP